MGCRSSKIQENRRIDEILRQSEIQAIKHHIEVYDTHIKRRSLDANNYIKSLNKNPEEIPIDSKQVSNMPNVPYI